MVQYICELCEKTFDHKGKYMQHLRRITPCNKSFTTKHIKISKEDRVVELEEKNKKLEEKIQKLEFLINLFNL